MQLNCDLGESYGRWTLESESAAMPHIDQANIACGFHAGDPVSIQQTLLLAKQYNVSVGAHPSYPDLQGFGRRSMQCSEQEIIALLHYQIAALEGLAKCAGIVIDYVKPHGALYNDMMSKEDVRRAVFSAIGSYHRSLPLMVLATANQDEIEEQANQAGITLYFEAFADRCYDDNGQLLSRKQAGAVHDIDKTLQQVKQLCESGSVTTHSGKILQLQADSLCVHGDNSQAVEALTAIRKMVEQCR
ncbi:5-oxoprolinase subunit PxpA [Neptunicella sp. SCSIO 80796]|uniref:5-oxoprolinase subunit PxpA n=1 Tax=Neptunicella plasticusilytica TaxID=3117012 RepID=UPI003A4D50F6